MPVIIISPEKALYFGRRFRKFAMSLKNIFPGIDSALLEGGIANISAVDYISAGIVVSILLAVLLFGVSLFLMLVAMQRGMATSQLTGILLVLVLVVPLIYLVYFINYPKLRA